MALYKEQSELLRVVRESMTCVYRYKSTEGNFVYIGVTAQLLAWRIYTHRRMSWFDTVATLDVATFTDHNEARAEARRQIHQHHPIYNKRCELCAESSTESGWPLWALKELSELTKP